MFCQRESPFILGTVQLGLPYGIANTTGKPDQSMANAIVAAVWEQDITTFDTAQGYGDSEAVLGQALHACGATNQARVITKLSPDLPMSSLEIEESLHASRNRLGISAFFCVMLHREEHLPFLDAHAGAALTEQRTAGLLKHIGVSVYTPEKALEALRHPLVDMVQVPASLFDRRFEAAGVFALAHEMGKQVHVRSAFLQGVLLMAPQQLPACLQELSPVLKDFHQICAAEGVRPTLAALLWLQHRYPDAAILFGAETQEQVRDNLDSTAWNSGLSPACIRQLDAILPPQKPELLNPSLWKR